MLHKLPSAPSVLLVALGAIIGASITKLSGAPSAITAEEAEHNWHRMPVRAQGENGGVHLGTVGASNIMSVNGMMDALEKRMMQQEKKFDDVLDGMHLPKLDVKNETNKYTLTVELSFSSAAADADGIQDAEIEIEVYGCMLTINYEHKEKSQYGSASYAESVSISAVPRDVDADAATSSYDPKTKLLTITLPKLAQQSKKKIPVKTSR